MPRADPAWRALRAVGMLLLCVLGDVAGAHTRSETQSSWQVQGQQLRARFIVPETEARRLSPDGATSPSDSALGHYLSEHVTARAAGAACVPTGEAYKLAAAPGYRRFEMRFDCPGSKGIELHVTAFFDLVRTHSHFARVEDSAGHFSEYLLGAERHTIEPGTDNPLQHAGFAEFVWLGMQHIFTGPDHMAFLLGLVLVSRRLRDLVFVVTGFTLGHSATLALAVTGVFRPHAELIDALVGATIVLIGAEIVVGRTQRALPVALTLAGAIGALALARWLGFGNMPALLLIGSGLFALNYLLMAGRLQEAARLRLVVTVVFGLIHGFGFAANLLEMQLPDGRLAELLLGFNLGVEVAQLMLVAGAIGAAAIAARNRRALPRAIVADFGAALLLAVGLYWFVSRSLA